MYNSIYDSGEYLIQWHLFNVIEIDVNNNLRIKTVQDCIIFFTSSQQAENFRSLNIL